MLRHADEDGARDRSSVDYQYSKRDMFQSFENTERSAIDGGIQLLPPHRAEVLGLLAAIFLLEPPGPRKSSRKMGEVW